TSTTTSTSIAAPTSSSTTTTSTSIATPTSSSTTMTSTSITVPISTSTTIRLPGTCVSDTCDDGDPCTADACVSGDCQHLPLTGIDSVRCRFQVTGFAGDVCLGQPVPSGISRRLARANALLRQAAAVSPKRALLFVKKAASILRRARILVALAGKRRISTDCVTALFAAIGDAVNATDHLLEACKREGAQDCMWPLPTTTTSTTTSTSTSTTSTTTLPPILNARGRWAFSGTLGLNDCAASVPYSYGTAVLIDQSGTALSGSILFSGTLGYISGDGAITGADSWELITDPICLDGCCLAAGIRASNQTGNVADGVLLVVSRCGAIHCTVGYAGNLSR